MSDQAFRDVSMTITPSWLPKIIKSEALRTAEPGVSVPESEPAQTGEPPATPTGSRDWSSALDLIREATEAIAISEQRAADLEVRLQQVSANAAEEIRQLNAKLAATERRAQKADERARHAEARASESETWLVRIHDAIANGFSRHAGAKPEETAEGEAERSAQAPEA